MEKTAKKTVHSVADKSKKTNKDYIEAVGRRKTAVARVRIYQSAMPNIKGHFVINDKDVKDYFPALRYREKALAPLKIAGDEVKATSIKVSGGGIMAQSDAVCLGLARAIVQVNKDLRGKFRSLGYLTRDPRAVERKKYGHTKARRGHQWRKR